MILTFLGLTSYQICLIPLVDGYQSTYSKKLKRQTLGLHTNSYCHWQYTSTIWTTALLHKTTFPA
jgi:hypothetical protein